MIYIFYKKKYELKETLIVIEDSFVSFDSTSFISVNFSAVSCKQKMRKSLLQWNHKRKWTENYDYLIYT